MIVDPHILGGMSRVFHLSRSPVARAPKMSRATETPSLWRRLISPVSDDEDKRRQEYVINTVLTISIAFLIVLETTIVVNYFRFDDYDGFSPVIFAGIILLFMILLIASKFGRGRYASYALVGAYAAGTLWSGWQWGESLPPVLLACALVIVTSSVLLGSSFGLSAAIFMIATLAVLGFHEYYSMGVPEWHNQAISVMDIVTYAVIFTFISFIAWLSSREIDKSLVRARKSEKSLAEERDSLERRVSERTDELLRSERMRMASAEHAVKFGNLARGLFHDLMSPLASIALYMENMANGSGDPNEVRDMVRKAVAASTRMKSFMDSVKHDGDCVACCDKKVEIGDKIKIIRDLLAYKARMAGVRMVVEQKESVCVKANPVRMRQLFLNLIDNALDACAGSGDDRVTNPSEKTVRISIGKSEIEAIVSIEDDGCGMSEENARKIFVEPFTTKRDGTGMGLSTAKSIVEKELRGIIRIQSKENIGTVCTITIPLNERVKFENQPCTSPP